MITLLLLARIPNEPVPKVADNGPAKIFYVAFSILQYELIDIIKMPLSFGSLCRAPLSRRGKKRKNVKSNYHYTYFIYFGSHFTVRSVRVRRAWKRVGDMRAIPGAGNSSSAKATN